MYSSNPTNLSNQTNDDSEDLECRVCRAGPDLPSRPLYSPCLCSGSIGLVHQDCLEAWLKHSQKEKCELCGLKYKFSPQYAENTPSKLPLSVLAFTMLRKLMKDYVPFVCRFITASIVWLIAVPLITCQLYRMWMRMETFRVNLLTERWSRDTLSGLVLVNITLLTFIVMVCSLSLYFTLLN